MEKSDIIVTVFILLIIIGISILFYRPADVIGNGDKATGGKKAPELQSIKGYINMNGIKISDLVGKKVILIDFWTYTCINCIRTLPYLKQWDEKYRGEGLQIIGVHTPEFEFEKEYNNVKKAVEEHGIKYPVVLDNDYATWNAYDNHYWPAKYLIDKNGNIVYTHFGEGNYEEVEAKIQELLKDLNSSIAKKPISKPEAVEAVSGPIGTPELYFGYNFRRAPLGNEPSNMDNSGSYDFVIPKQVVPNRPYLEGKWKNNDDNFELVSETGRIVLIYKAKSVNIVAGSSQGSEIDSSASGKLSIGVFNMYRVADDNNYESRLLELNITGKGFKIYTFTFG